MIENHEVLCPTFIDCTICQTKRDMENIERITNLFGINDDLQILTKHFYQLTISVTPSRETYFRFTLEPLKKVGRELINGLSSISSVSNRKWWSLFVQSGVRYFSIEQKNTEDYPTFNHHFIFYSEKDNVDSRIETQLKYRLKKISRHFEYKIDYLGKYDLGTIKNTIKLGVAVDFNSVPIIKLGEEIVEEIYKIKDQKPIVFGEKYNKKSSNKLELIS
jgi:hypothetical protein